MVIVQEEVNDDSERCVVLCGEVMEPSPVSSPVSVGVSRQ